MDEELDLRELFWIIRKRLWMIVGLFVAAVVIAGYVSWFRMTPIYEATATILIDNTQSNPLQDLTSMLTTGQSKNQLSNYVEILKSRTLAEKVVDRLGWAASDSDSASQMEAIRRSISIKPQTNSDIIKIAVRNESPAKAQLIADTVVEVFEEQNRLNNQSVARSAKEFIEGQLAIVKSDVETAENELMKYQQEQGIFAPSEETAAQIEKIAGLETQRASLQLALSDAKARLDQLQKQYDAQEKSVVSATTYTESPEIQMYRKQLADLEVSLANARERYTDKHPTVKSLIAEIDATKQQLDKEVGKVVSSQTETANPIAQTLLGQIAQVRAEIYGKEAEISGLDNMIKVESDKLSSLPAKELDLARLLRNQEVKDQIYSLLLTRYEEIRISEAMSTADVQVVDSAELPTSPVSPNKKLNVAIAGFLALFVGVGLAFLIEYLDTSIKTVEEVEKVLGLPVIGQIPEIREVARNGRGRRKRKRRLRSVPRGNFDAEASNS